MVPPAGPGPIFFVFSVAWMMLDFSPSVVAWIGSVAVDLLLPAEHDQLD